MSYSVLHSFLSPLSPPVRAEHEIQVCTLISTPTISPSLLPLIYCLSFRCLFVPAPLLCSQPSHRPYLSGINYISIFHFESTGTAQLLSHFALKRERISHIYSSKFSMKLVSISYWCLDIFGFWETFNVFITYGYYFADDSSFMLGLYT